MWLRGWGDLNLQSWELRFVLDAVGFVMAITMPPSSCLGGAEWPSLLPGSEERGGAFKWEAT
ncbi:hypothetical protein GCM10007981_02820 [Thermocladium modestius]|uniref:Uncharacterized protein n=1 Tax=Thermocladium modestius TaxID=62609 RepID=A0A830GRA9_9CREN|nr:hypothetical protein GCM10007981_02820 [Thermocladium modestius]